MLTIRKKEKEKKKKKKNERFAEVINEGLTVAVSFFIESDKEGERNRLHQHGPQYNCEGGRVSSRRVS